MSGLADAPTQSEALDGPPLSESRAEAARFVPGQPDMWAYTGSWDLQNAGPAAGG